MTVDTDVLSAELDRIRLELQSLQAERGEEKITIGNYLLSRLAQLGVTVSRAGFTFFILFQCPEYLFCAGHVWSTWRF